MGVLALSAFVTSTDAAVTFEKFIGSGTAGSGDGGGALNAEAEFTLESSGTSGSSILIQILNTTANPTFNPNTVLANIFFSGITISTISSQTLPGGTIYTSGTPSSVTPGSTFAANGLELWQIASTYPSGATGGVGFGGTGTGNSVNKQKDGLVGPGQTPDKDTVIKNEVDLTITTTANITSLNVGNVSFQYGTAQNYSIPGTLQVVPEANYGWAAVLLLLPIGWQVMQRKNRSPKVATA